MTTKHRPTRCMWCAKKVKQKRRARARKTCSNACRQAWYRWRLKRKELLLETF